MYHKQQMVNNKAPVSLDPGVHRQTSQLPGQVTQVLEGLHQDSSVWCYKAQLQWYWKQQKTDMTSNNYGDCHGDRDATGGYFKAGRGRGC